MLNLTVLGLAPPDLGAVDFPLPPDPGGFLGALMVSVDLKAHLRLYRTEHGQGFVFVC